MTRFLILTIIFMTYFNIINGNFPVPLITPESCNSDEYFDSLCLTCRRCGKDEQKNLQVKAPDGSCKCKPHYFLKERNGPYDIKCESCPKEKVPSVLGDYCITCDKDNPYNATLEYCEPCVNGSFIEDGVNMKCISCHQKGFYEEALLRYSVCPDLNIPTPKNCALKNMTYSGGNCLPQNEVKSEPALFNIKFENDINVQSAFFKEHLNAVRYNCKQYLNATACQALANMCMLLMYRLRLIAEGDACSEFWSFSKKRINKCPGQLWLYYIDDDYHRDAPKVLYKDNIPNTYTPNLKQDSSRVQIFAMKYHINGTFIGMSKIVSNDLNLCTTKSTTNDDLAFIFGTRVEQTCTISLKSLWDNSEVVFYDLYLASDIKNRSSLYPIPILIRGLKVNGELVNTDPDMSKWLLVRRFFLTDHISGIETGSSHIDSHRQPIAKVFRYAAEVTLKLTMRLEESPGKIFPPLLIISYAEATPDDYMRNMKVTVKFTVFYELDQTTTNNGITITLGILSTFAISLSCIQTWSWFRRSGKHAFDLLTLGKFLIFTCGNLANVFFIVIFCVSLNWMLFFKKQDVMHLLLPTPEQEKILGIYIGFAFAMKLLQVIHLLVVQCSINIFFIDWERPRSRPLTSASRAATSSSKTVAESIAGADGQKSSSSSVVKGTPDKINTEMAGVSIWRTYFAANEWAEIQSKRKTNLNLQLFGVLIFLKVLQFENYARASPKFDLASDAEKYVPYSTCCRFALGAAIYLSLGFLQIIIRKGIYERFIEDKLQLYVDLCSVSNVSVFILISKRFGYYIHGRSVHGRADVNMKEMHEFLRREEEDLCGHRGLLPNTDQQTFQMVLPSGVYDQFLRLLVPLTAYSQAADRMQGVGGRLAKVDIDRVANTHYMLNKFLSGFIEHSFKDLDYIVKDKVVLENLLDIECYEVADRGYFYNDDGHSFDAVIFYGNESILLIFDVLLFSIIDITFSDYVLAAIFTFIIAKAIQALRQSAGRRNLVRKALVDERFLT